MVATSFSVSIWSIRWCLFRRLSIVLCCVFFNAGWGIAGTSSDPKFDPEFPRTNKVRVQMFFWEQIFSRFPSTTTVVHDSDNMANVVDIVDHLLLMKNKGSKRVPSVRARADLNNLYLKRYKLALSRFRRIGKKALQFGAIEKRIYSVYSRHPSELKRLYKGNINLRTQSGLADEFLKAAGRAQDYLPYMERVFVQTGVPTRIIKLAFVESMFNLKAKSKVGASGIWQFMPGTARQYMTVNRFIDERNSPFKATKAAARLLSDNYRALKSWPLAITAYNHGRGGMEKAVRQTGTRNFDVILEKYKSRSFGFASKNFYAEFLAADYVYDKFIAEGKIARRPSKLNLSAVRLDPPRSIHQLMRYTPLNKKMIKKHNPCITKLAYQRGKYRILPKAYELFVPTNLVAKVEKALTKIRPTGRRIALKDRRR